VHLRIVRGRSRPSFDEMPAGRRLTRNGDGPIGDRAVKTNQLAKFAAVVLALAGVAALLAAVVVSLRSFEVSGPVRKYDCCSVLFAKDPRDLAPRRANVPHRLVLANTKCEKVRNERTHKALVFMLAGVVPLLIVLALPFFSRRSRRSRVRRRSRM